MDICKEIRNGKPSQELIRIVTSAVGETRNITGPAVDHSSAEYMKISPDTEIYTDKSILIKLIFDYKDSEHDRLLPHYIKLKQYKDDISRIGFRRKVPSRYDVEKILTDFIYTHGYYHDEKENRQIRAVPEIFKGNEGIEKELDEHKLIMMEYIVGNSLGRLVKDYENKIEDMSASNPHYKLIEDKIIDILGSAVYTLALFHVTSAKYEIEIKEKIKKEGEQELTRITPNLYTIMTMNYLEHIIKQRNIKDYKNYKEAIGLAVNTISPYQDPKNNNLVTIIHGDPHLLNFIKSEQDTKLVDCGHVKIGLQEQDIAYMLVNTIVHRPFDAVKRLMCKYLDKRKSLESKLGFDQKYEIDKEQFCQNFLLFSLGGLIKMAGTTAYTLM